MPTPKQPSKPATPMSGPKPGTGKPGNIPPTKGTGQPSKGSTPPKR